MSQATDHYFLEKKFRLTKEEVQEIFRDLILSDPLLSQRPANEIILDEARLRKMLDLSKRTLATLRASRMIEYFQPIPRGKITYTLQGALDFIESGRKPSISIKRKF